MSSSCCQVRVAVRIRPLTSQEIKQGGKQVLDVAPPCIGIGERRFTYDAVFDSFVSQQELYESVSKPLLTSFVDGYNATVRIALNQSFLSLAVLHLTKFPVHFMIDRIINYFNRSWHMDKLDQEKHLQWAVKHTRNPKAFLILG